MTFENLNKMMRDDWRAADAVRLKSANACHRKSVVCRIQDVTDGYLYASATNGPVLGSKCSGVVGGCGCMHAEISALTAFQRYMIRHWNPYHHGPIVIVSTWSPCTACANAIIDFAERYRDVVRVAGVVAGGLTEHDTRGWSRLNSYLPALLLDRWTESFEYTTEEFFKVP